VNELPRTVVVFALRAESGGVFEAAAVPVLYCGVGKVNAAIALCSELSRYRCAGLGFALGVTPYDEAPARIRFERRFTQLPSAVCGSGDSFATVHVEVACEVLDMEAYALAKVCRHEQADFACVKYVTDGADHTAANDWQRNVHKAAEEFLSLFRCLDTEGAL
jgi:adenosylhomocysteine nucleosidase